MTLPRRTFLGLAAGLLPASALAVELRSGSGGDSPTFQAPPGGGGRMGKMLFRGTSNRQFGLSSILVLADGGAWYADFTNRVVRRDEDKLGILRDIPLVGQFFAPTLRGRDFIASQQIGLTFQLKDTLLVDLHRTDLARQQLAQRILSAEARPPVLTMPSAGQPVQTVAVANQKISYFLLGPPSPVGPDSAPAPLRALAAGETVRSIGKAYVKGSDLLVLVSPSILTGWS